LLFRTWTHQSSYGDILFLLPLYPEVLLLEAIQFSFGPDATVAKFFAALAFSLVLAVCSVTVVLFAEWLERAVRRQLSRGPRGESP
jgi:hypothetical protein